MRQVIVGGRFDSCTAHNPGYNLLMGSTDWGANEATRREVIPTGGTISRLYIKLSSAVAAASTITFALMVNGVASALIVTLSAGDTEGSDTINEISVSAGDIVMLRSTNTGAPGTPGAKWSTLFDSTNERESICLVSTASSNAATLYSPPQGLGRAVTTWQKSAVLMPIGGIFKNMYVDLEKDPGTAPDAYSITLQKNGVDTALTCTIVANDTTGNDIVNTVAVTSSNLVNLEITPLNTPTQAPAVAIGLVFISETDGESLIIGGYENEAPGNTTGYYPLAGGTSCTINANESLRESLIQECTLYSLTVYMDVAPGAGKSRQWDLRLNGADSGKSVLISDTDVSGRDIASATATDGETCSMKHTPTGGPDATTCGHWAAVCFFRQPVVDVDATIRAYLVTQDELTELVGTRIYCPRLPENAVLPAISFFVRGGTSNPHIAPVVSPSVQFDCWADNPIEARSIYRMLYSVLQGLQEQAISGRRILSATEEVQGMDMVDVEIPNYFRVLTFFEVIIG